MELINIPVETRTYSKVRTIGEYYEMISSGEIVLNPVWQRAPRIEPDKEPAILASMILGDPICNFINKKESDDSESSVDGGHRSRAIENFINSKVSLPNLLDGEKIAINISGEKFDISGKFYHELPTNVRDWFLDRELAFTIIDEKIPADQVGVYFRRANKNSKVSMMEMFNSYGNHPLSRLIRNIVRTIDPEETEPHHVIFDFFENIGSKNDKMCWDEFVMRIAMYVITVRDGNPWYSAPKREKEFQTVYNRFQNVPYETLKKKYYKDIVCYLTFIVHMLNTMKNAKRMKQVKSFIDTKKIDIKRLLKFLFFIFFLARKFPDHVKSFVDYNKLLTLWDEMEAIAERDNFTYTEKELDITNSDKIFRNRDAWNDYPTKVGSSKKSSYGNGAAEQYWETLLEKYFTEALGNKSIQDFGVLLKDGKRTFDQKDIVRKLHEQNYVCALTNAKVTIDEVDGDHIIPWSEGGTTTYDNLRVIKSSVNRSSKRMNILK